MKTALRTASIIATATVLALSDATTAVAAPRAPDPQTLYTCSNQGLSRVSLDDRPAPCCNGMLGCPQLLSNTGLIKPKHDNRT